MNKYRIFTRCIQVMLLLTSTALSGGPGVFTGGIDGTLRSGIASHGTSSVRRNPAAVRDTNGISILLSVNPSPFGLPALTDGDALIQWRQGTTGIGLSASTIGFPLYRETTGSFHFSMEGRRDIRLGISLSANHAAIAGYGSRTAFLLDGGILWQYHPDILFGVTVRNVNGGSWDGEDDLPREIGAGTALQVTDGLVLLMDFVKDLRYPVEFRSAMRYSPIDGFRFEAGMEGSRSLSAAVSMRWTDLDLSVGTSRHPVLGFSTTLQVILDLQ